MSDQSRVQKGAAGAAELGHNSAVLDEKRQTMYHNNKNRVFVRAIAGEYNVKEELTRLRSVPRVRKASEVQPVSAVISLSPKMGSRKPSICIWKNMRRAQNPKSMAM